MLVAHVFEVFFGFYGEGLVFVRKSIKGIDLLWYLCYNGSTDLKNRPRVPCQIVII